MFDLVRATSTRVTFNDGTSPVWSLDGKHLYFVKRDGIYRRAADGSGEEELLWKGSVLPGFGSVLAVAPDGSSLLFRDSTTHLRLQLAGERKPVAYGKSNGPNEFYHTFSRDGRWIAYAAQTSATGAEIFVRGYPEERGKWQISASGGSLPRWRADGRELYWITGFSGEGSFMAATIEPQTSGLRTGKPEKLFARPQGSFVGASADGRRFLFVEEDEGTTAKEYPMVVIRNLAARGK